MSHKRLWGVAFAALTLGLVGATDRAEASSISVTPSTPTAVVGETVAVSIDISNVSDLSSLQFTLNFDASVLQADAPAQGAFLPAAGSTFFIPGTVDNAAGSVTFLAESLLGPVPGASGSGTLATVTFTAIGLGTSPIAMLFDPANGDALFDSSFSEINASTIGSSITVAAAAEVVPEPGTPLWQERASLRWHRP
jgi:general secretion pathway protein D